jgi:hypothetical protein
MTFSRCDNQRRDTVLCARIIDEIDLLVDHTLIGDHFREVFEGAPMEWLQEGLQHR